jgi:hypothetical protein
MHFFARRKQQAQTEGAEQNDKAPVQASAAARPLLIFLTASMALIMLIVNLTLPRDGAWRASHQFSLHAYEKHIGASTQFTGPFMSKVYVLPSVRGNLRDSSTTTHVNCTSGIFDEMHTNKCKMMRSAPMYLGNVTNSWSVLGAQSMYTLNKHIFVLFLVFSIFWVSEYALTDFHHKIGGWSVVLVRNAVVFTAVLAFVAVLASNVTGNMSVDVAIGSVSTSFSLVVVCLLIICFEYAFMNGKLFLLEQPSPAVPEAPAVDLKPVTDLEQADVDAAAAASQTTPAEVTTDAEINKPLKEHMHRNIYLSYACLLTFPLVVVLMLAQRHAAVVDVHIQLCFFSFIFFATLDVFQTRTTAILLCMQTEPATGLGIGFIKFFVVLAFCLCKCFALLPALVLMHTLYATAWFQQATLWIHYVVLFGLVAADLFHIKWQHRFTDVAKILFVLVYTAFVFIALAFVDGQKTKSS